MKINILEYFCWDFILYLDKSLIIPLGVGVSAGVLLTLFLVIVFLHCKKTKEKPLAENTSGKNALLS